MDLLARREHAVAELSRKLIEKGFDQFYVAEELATLVGEGLLCDSRYAESYVRSRMEKGFGPIRIREEMRQRGIDGRLVGDHLDFSDPSWIELAREAWLKRFSGGLPGDLKERARQMSFLQYRGFTSEQIKHIFNDPD